MNGMTDDPQFKFKVGDRVRHAVGNRGAAIVVQRVLVDCYGGRQAQYLLREGFPYGASAGSGLVEISEPELRPDRPYCEGCAYGYPIQDAPGMKSGRAHVHESGRSVCVHANPEIA